MHSVCTPAWDPEDQVMMPQTAVYAVRDTVSGQPSCQEQSKPGHHDKQNRALQSGAAHIQRDLLQ